MIRRIINIDQNKCNGCGICADACHEGAIGMVDDKATLLKDDYCDGLGDCLPVCPTGAITFVEREAAAYDEVAVKARMAVSRKPMASGCPGSMSRNITHTDVASAAPSTLSTVETAPPITSQLSQWPVQIKLVRVNAPYFDQANLLIAADCTAFAYGNFHNRFIKNHVTLIGCPKLDEGDYADKLTEILQENRIKSVTVVRMEVPCCGGIENAFKTALRRSDKLIPWQVITVSLDGQLLED